MLVHFFSTLRAYIVTFRTTNILSLINLSYIQLILLLLFFMIFFI